MFINSERLRRPCGPSSICLRAVGDLNFGLRIGKKIREEPSFSPLPNITESIGPADIAFFNLECIPVADPAAHPASNMLAPAQLLDDIRQEFTVANIANNHTMDAGPDAFCEILRQLKTRRFFIVGGGENLKEAAELRIITRAGLRIGFLGCADFVTAPHRQGNHATARRPGVGIYRPRRLIRRIQREKARVDLLICSLHTGLEFHSYPDPLLMKHARLMIDAGADVILIHHAHVRQGIECYKEGLIAYGLGNFMFDTQSAYMQREDVAPHIGLVLDILLDTRGVSGYTFWLSRIEQDGSARLLTDTEVHRALYREQREFNERLSDAAFIAREWRRVCRRDLRQFYYALYWALRRKNYIYAMRLVWDLRRREQRRRIMGFCGH